MQMCHSKKNIVDPNLSRDIYLQNVGFIQLGHWRFALRRGGKRHFVAELLSPVLLENPNAKAFKPQKDRVVGPFIETELLHNGNLYLLKPYFGRIQVASHKYEP